MIPFTFPTYVQGDGTIACRAKVITDTTGLVRWIDYTPIKFVASMTNMGTTNTNGSQAIELITQTTGLVKGIDYIVVYVDSSATVPWSTNANGYIPCYSAPYSLFASSETGVWYDPSDFSTLFQDSAGTTPVTAVEQPVGLMLDKSKGLVLGAELVTNGDFSQGSAGWSLTTPGADYGSSISGGVARVWTNAGGTYSSITVSGASQIAIGKTYKFSIQIISSTGVGVAFSIGGAQVAISTIAGVYTGYLTATSTAQIEIKRNAANCDCTIDNISVRELPGNHASQSTAGKRPVLQQDGNGCYYLAFNGTSSAMATNSIDFTATDKMTVFAGVRKLSDAAAALFAELSANAGTVYHGAFYVASPENTGASGDFSFKSTGTVFAVPAYTPVIAAPVTKVMTCIGSISTDVATIRINGAEVATSASDQGTGNYGNYPLYIGARAGTSLFFNGNLYSMIARGAQSSAAQIASAEAYVNSKTRAF